MKFDIKRVVVSDCKINPTEEETLNEFANIILSLEDMFVDAHANFEEFVYEYYGSMSKFIKAFGTNTDEVIKDIVEWLGWD